MMQDQDMAGNQDIMRILEEKQMMKDCLDPRVRYFPTSNIDLCDNVDDKGNFCAGLMVHKREKIATEIVLISLESFKDIIPGINNCVRIESQVPILIMFSFLSCLTLIIIIKIRLFTTAIYTSSYVVVATGTQRGDVT